EDMSGFDISLNNWDDVKLRFKYSDSTEFAVGQRVAVQLGYADTLLTVVTGTISTLSPTFPDTASPTVAISGVDGMQKLKDSKPAQNEPKIYRQMTDWQIATQVAQRNQLRIVTTQEGPTYEQVVQKNQDDATFLVERAKRVDFDCFLLTDADSGADTLYFIRPTDGRDGRPMRVYQLAYGPGLSTDPTAASAAGSASAGPTAQPAGLLPNLISFTPTLTISRQVGSLTVRGWDPRTKQAITYTATATDLPASPDGTTGQSGPAAADSALGGRQDVVIDAPVESDQEAKDLATSLLRERAYEFITATGRIAGLPELQPADNLQIFGLGRRFSGSYYVKRVEHTLNSSGFFTDFTARRIFDGGSQ
ncbi:MAG: phage late control D family protein, partial [Micromonosporaceae bacterium]|nr:phage late control D family protein [Micromonosporaceae bacterium]